MGLRAAFRVDAGVAIGSGHAMRCLTLADALAQAGAECLFLMRPHGGHLSEMIAGRGHVVTMLTLPADAEFGAHPTPPDHAEWLGGAWRLDADETRDALDAFRPDWLVVDHYALDRTWQERALPEGVRLFVIDDLADRSHRADLLLDQNFGRKAADYDPFVPATCQRLIGPEYALLRPEFAAMRPKALVRRAAAVLRHLLITLGGIDKDNVTGKLLEALAEMDLPQGFEITVVMGAMAPWRDAVIDQAAKMPRATRVLTGVSNMAELMAEADLCIGAVGGTTWERCVLALPTIILILAENQRPAAQALDKAEVCVLLEDVEELSNALERLREPSGYQHYVERSAKLGSGQGADFVVRALQKRETADAH